MKGHELCSVLKAWNDEWFKALGEKLDAALSVPAGASAEDGVRITKLMADERCYCGEFNDHELFPDEIRHESSKTSVAVGAVLDDESDLECDLPVVVAVGINYWQFGTNAAPWVANGWRTTRMRRRLDAATRSLADKCWQQEPPSRYHLVAINFFPWVTRRPWSDLPNGLTEALALHCWGLPDAPERIARLIGLVSSSSIVAFHGVNNAVPMLALRTVHALTCRPAVIFTDNLAYPTPPKNVATLRNHVGRSSIRRTHDE